MLLVYIKDKCLLVTCSFSSLNNNLSSSLVLCYYVLDVVVKFGILCSMLQMHKKILISPVMNTRGHRTEDIVCLVVSCQAREYANISIYIIGVHCIKTIFHGCIELFKVSYVMV